MSRIDRLEIAMEVLVDHNMLEEAEKLERIAMARTDQPKGGKMKHSTDNLQTSCRSPTIEG